MRERESKNGFKSCKKRQAKNIKSLNRKGQCSAAVDKGVKLVPYSESSSEEEAKPSVDPSLIETNVNVNPGPSGVSTEPQDPKNDPTKS